ncbi:MAG: hypothetical protein ACM34A_05145, partial [Bacillota bacterium]
PNLLQAAGQTGCQRPASRKEFDVFNWTLLEGPWHYEWGHIISTLILQADFLKYSPWHSH